MHAALLNESRLHSVRLTNNFSSLCEVRLLVFYFFFIYVGRVSLGRQGVLGRSRTHKLIRIHYTHSGRLWFGGAPQNTSHAVGEEFVKPTKTTPRRGSAKDKKLKRGKEDGESRCRSDSKTARKRGNLHSYGKRCKIRLKS